MSAAAMVFGATGRIALNQVFAATRVTLLIADTMYWMCVAPLLGKGLRVRATLDQFVSYGAHSLPIVGLICFLIGAIMAMQSAYQLEAFGMLQLVPALVGVSGMRELAPLMAAIIVTGRSGSAITAEIGTMKVSEELDALEVMGVNITKQLVVPKVLGMLLALPCLTVLAILIMMAGGYTLSVFGLGLTHTLYIENTANYLDPVDFATGMTKSVFFALTIALVGVYRGLQVEGGAEGVGKMTTASVVTSIFLIIVVDLLFTALFFF